MCVLCTHFDPNRVYCVHFMFIFCFFFCSSKSHKSSQSNKKITLQSYCISLAKKKKSAQSSDLKVTNTIFRCFFKYFLIYSLLIINEIVNLSKKTSSSKVVVTCFHHQNHVLKLLQSSSKVVALLCFAFIIIIIMFNFIILQAYDQQAVCQSILPQSILLQREQA
jgi:hypothetical protein